MGRFQVRVSVTDGIATTSDSFKVTVTNTVQIVDDSASAFTSTGFATATDQGFGNDVQYAAVGNGSAVARWSFDNLTAGQYRVSATWSAHSNRATNAPFVIRDAAGNQLGIASVNQEASPSDFVDANIGWRDLGAAINFNGGSLIVELSNAADEFVIADAIRIERIGDLSAVQANNESIDNLFANFEESLMDDLLAV